MLACCAAAALPRGSTSGFRLTVDDGGRVLRRGLRLRVGPGRSTAGVSTSHSDLLASELAPLVVTSCSPAGLRCGRLGRRQDRSCKLRRACVHELTTAKHRKRQLHLLGTQDGSAERQREVLSESSGRALFEVLTSEGSYMTCVMGCGKVGETAGIWGVTVPLISSSFRCFLADSGRLCLVRFPAPPPSSSIKTAWPAGRVMSRDTRSR